MGGKTQDVANQGMKKCCLYQGSDRKRFLICTSDQECPKLNDGSTLVGSWNVGSCDECRIISETTSSRLPKHASDDPPKH
jgi:hypothetical protein